MGQLRRSRKSLGAFFLLLCFFVQVEWITTAIAAKDSAGLDSSVKSRFGNYGGEFVQFARSQGIDKVRLHDADPTMLRALGGGGYSRNLAPIEVIVGLKNEQIFEIGASVDLARSWVTRNVLPYYPVTNIVAIAVGNQVGWTEGAHDQVVVASALPAMRNIRVALMELRLEKKIKVTASLSLDVLSGVFPPSSATFDQRLLLSGGALAPLLDFLEAAGSFLMVDLLESTSHTQAVSDALVAALASANHPKLGVVVAEAGPVRPGPAIGHSANFHGGLFEQVSKPATSDSDGLKISLDKGRGRSASGSGTLSARRLLVRAPAPIGPDARGRRKLANKSWCVAKSGQTTDQLQSALDWACGSGADCSAIQLGQSCYLPNDIQAHASYAFNSYYQKRNWASDSCDFQGLATVTSTDPSSASCLYASNTNANGGPSTPTGTIVPPAPPSYAPSLSWNPRYLILTSLALAFLLKRSFLNPELRNLE